jgi:hypothetical protein
MATERGDSSAAVGGTPTDVESTFEQSSLNGTTATGNAKLVVRDATQIEMIDTLNLFTATTVEGGLQEIANATLGNITWGVINGTLSNQTDLQAALDLKVDDTEVASVDGTAEASKLFKTDSNKDITGLNEVTLTDDINAVNAVLSGDVNSVNVVATGDIDASTGTIDTLDATSIHVETGSVYRRNVIRNGCMSVAQRGTSIVSPTSGAYTLDGWRFWDNGGGAVTVTQSTDAPTIAQAGRKISHSLKLDVTTADTSIAAGDYYMVAHEIEGHTYAAIAGSTATVQFWIKSTKTGTMGVSVHNSGYDRSYASNITINSANTWEQKSIQIPLTEEGGTWDYTNGAGLRLYFDLKSGSTYQTADLDQWNSAEYHGSSAGTNFMDNVANDIYITGVQLAPSNVITDLEIVTYQEMLDECKRYAQQLLTGVAFEHIANGAAGGATIFYVSEPLDKEMRDTPTAVTSTLSNFRVYDSGSYTVTGFTYTGSRKSFKAEVVCSAATSVAGRAALFQPNTTGQSMLLSAELS